MQGLYEWLISGSDAGAIDADDAGTADPVEAADVADSVAVISRNARVQAQLRELTQASDQDRGDTGTESTSIGRANERRMRW